MRNYSRIDSYLNRFIGEVYPQPEADDLHPALTKKVIDHWLSRLTDCNSVLDVGAGTGFAQPMFAQWQISYEGVSLGEDYLFAQEKGRNVKRMDYSFLEYPDESFDLVFSRHSLEHSPMPLLTLMEWRRVSMQWLGLVVPAAEWYNVRGGQNHYYVLFIDQWKNLLDNSGWNVIWEDTDELPTTEAGHKKPHEYWLFCEKAR